MGEEVRGWIWRDGVNVWEAVEKSEWGNSKIGVGEMKEELLREDEIHVSTSPSKLMETFELFRQRLIEEREKNAKLEKELERVGNIVLGEG